MTKAHAPRWSDSSGFLDRLHVACSGRTYPELGALLGATPDTVRRYLTGAPPPADALHAICSRLDVSADWLLTGRGRMRASDWRRAALEEASDLELRAALGEAPPRGAEPPPPRPASAVPPPRPEIVVLRPVKAPP